MRFVRQNKQFMYLRWESMLISIRKRDMRILLEEPDPGRHKFKHGSVSICNLFVGIEFLNRINSLYNTHATK